MPSPFPGMDPYLERPTLWPDVHHELISEIRASLTRQLRPRYFTQVQERVYISTEDDPGRIIMIPVIQVFSPNQGRQPRIPAGGDGVELAEPIVVETLLEETIREPYLEILNVENHKDVTVIEVLSPDNKVSRSQGLESFRLKRETIIKSRSHWVEIDLLRGGISLAVRKRIRAHEYFVHISPVSLRAKRQGLVWPIRLSQRLPIIRIPLGGKEDAQLELQAVVDTIYDRVGYDQVINYAKEPVPPLNKEWKAWADQLLRAKGLRRGKARN
jgi:Protein of unknown function (DUF4058)